MEANVSEENSKKGGTRWALMEQEIFDHATRLFAQRGFSGTSFQDIADAVGLTRPALYHYVKSKDDLLAKLVAEVTVVAATDIGEVAKRVELSAVQRLRDIVQLLVRRQGEQGERFRLLLRSEADLPEAAAAAYAENRRAVLRSLTDVIEQGVAQGEFRPVSATVAALGTLGMVNWVAWWYHAGSQFDLDSVCSELAEMAVHSIAAEEGRLAAPTPVDALRNVRSELDRLEGLLGG
jgi:AcrR family transcriptional regulator